MSANRNRQRPIQVKFFVNEKELDLIKQKIAQLGTENISAYLRKMAIGGYVVNLDIPELRELISKMKWISNSENQIAKQLNTTGNIYEADIEEIKKNQEEIFYDLYSRPFHHAVHKGVQLLSHGSLRRRAQSFGVKDDIFADTAESPVISAPKILTFYRH